MWKELVWMSSLRPRAKTWLKKNEWNSKWVGRPNTGGRVGERDKKLFHNSKPDLLFFLVASKRKLFAADSMKLERMTVLLQQNELERCRVAEVQSSSVQRDFCLNLELNWCLQARTELNLNWTAWTSSVEPLNPQIFPCIYFILAKASH